MVSRENKVVGGFVVVAMALTFGGRLVTELPDALLMGVLLFVGVLAPMAVNNYLENRDAD
ncbi:hypothetical protein [Halobiforma nitratireducens]|uniref:hypothetical protein n=1 Tax=Halobiforma nitratireducens TaxID=130048 RepID=UPI0006777825|nr:hypothetical protein [Halobiforma nitratireducens]